MKTKKNFNTKSGDAKFRFELDRCSKNKDLASAIALYESSISSNNNIRLNNHHFNALLYLCSVSVTDPDTKNSAIEYGFRIFDHMISSEITPNEATITALARLCVAKGDGDYAFEIVKGMKDKYGLVPKLRSFDPALFHFCEVSEAEKAYKVEKELALNGLIAEETHYCALLKVSVEVGNGDKVYEYLHKLRSEIGCVSMDTVEVIESWFRNKLAKKVKSCDFGDVGATSNVVSNVIRNVMTKNGGGWHGLGWMGKGKWSVSKSNVEAGGRCCYCGEQLVCVDIDKEETDKFAQSIASLALVRESKGNFNLFMDWLGKHGNYEAIVDGANIALYQQNYADSSFSISQLDAVVRDLYRRSSQKKWPLVILHNKRVRALMENPISRKLLEEWKAHGALYTTPNGSNDDWYWLYAAIKLKCLLVTNDEMRDHIFELVGSKFILKWKDRHQVRYTFTRGNVRLIMPAPFSSVIQESENGKWHVPITRESEDDSPTSWLCITRPKTHGKLDKAATNKENSENAKTLNSNHSLLVACNSVSTGTKIIFDNPESPQNDTNIASTVTGKRKDRSE